MATEILLPQWGMEMQDGTIVRWLKKEGDPVQEGEPLVEVETAKLETEMESIVSGVVAQILVPAGETVPIRTVLAIVAAPGEEVAPRSSYAPSTRAAKVSGPAPVAPGRPGRSPGAGGGTPVQVQAVPAARRLASQQGIDLARVVGTGPGGRVLVDDVQGVIDSPAAPREMAPVQVVPAARRLAQQHGLDLAQVEGTGPRGRVLISDVERAIESLPKLPAQAVPISGLRQTIARRMLESVHSMAQVTLTTEADVTDAMRIREGLARQWTEGGLSPMHLVIKATARALKQHPRMNAVQAEDRVDLVEDINIGVAVSLPEGLMVPTLRHAHEKSLAMLAGEARELAMRARDGVASHDEVSGGTFTITNLGAHDIDAFTPIINPPQVGILGVGRVVVKPAVYQGDITKRSMMFLSLTFDHRVIDGVPAAEFLSTVKSLLEDPWWMVT